MSNDASSPLGGSDVDVDVDVDMDTETLTNGSRSVDGGATPRPELVNESAPVNIIPLLGRLEPRPEHHDVCIVGAGPAGLMLGYVTHTQGTLGPSRGYHLSEWLGASTQLFSLTQLSSRATLL